MPAIHVLDAMRTSGFRRFLRYLDGHGHTAEAYRAVTGRWQDPSKRDDLNGYALLLDRKTIDRLTALRGPGKSYSDVILRAEPSP